MTQLSVVEWGRVPVGEGGFSRAEADRLLAAASAHPSGGRDGTSIITDHHRWLRAQQVVGVLSAQNCSLEILPKIDGPEGPSTDATSHGRVRDRLIHMLDVALDLKIGTGKDEAIARQNETLIDVLIRIFVGRLADEVRRGLPRRYIREDDDLPMLRGRLDIARQFTKLAVRPDKIACAFDALSPDTPLLQVMKASVVFLLKRARRSETKRRLMELRLAFEDVSDVPFASLPWERIQIDRTNQRWRSLVALARLFLKRQWQATHRATNSSEEGVTLLFAMNDLFESYVAVLLRRILTPLGYKVIAQGGLRYCLDEVDDQGRTQNALFQTSPDIIVSLGGNIKAIVDTKWKRLSAPTVDQKRGVSQSDIYQLMAYAQLYRCSCLILIYPHSNDVGANEGVVARHRIRSAAANEMLMITSIDLSYPADVVRESLMATVQSAFDAVITNSLRSAGA